VFAAIASDPNLRSALLTGGGQRRLSKEDCIAIFRRTLDTAADLSKKTQKVVQHDEEPIDANDADDESNNK